MQSPSFCELLGTRIVIWSSNSTAESAELQPLASLTRLTGLCVRDGTKLMTELRHLRHLDSLTVHKVSALANKVPLFNNLQYLSLSDCPDEIWDFSSCSRLVILKISSLGDTMKAGGAAKWSRGHVARFVSGNDVPGHA